MRVVDACLGEPSAQLGAGASRKRQAGRELYGAGRLAYDHHAVAGIARDDRKRGWQISRVDTLRARAYARVKTRERASRVSDH